MQTLLSWVRDFSTAAGDVFGELMEDGEKIGKSIYRVRALTHCDLHKITKEDLVEVFESYPEYREKFWKGLILTFNLTVVSQDFIYFCLYFMGNGNFFIMH